MPPVPSPKPASTDIEQKLDIIVACLDRMDRRDRLRTWGAFVRGILGLIPLLFFLFSIWYIAKHGDELLIKITQEAARQAAIMTEQQGSGMMQRIQEMIPR